MIHPQSICKRGSMMSDYFKELTEGVERGTRNTDDIRPLGGAYRAALARVADGIAWEVGLPRPAHQQAVDVADLFIHVTALSAILMEKGVFTHREWITELATYAEGLASDYEHKRSQARLTANAAEDDAASATG